MNNEENGIKIPIKDIVEQSMIKNNSKYQEDEFDYLRKYFIACLNLGYLKPNELVEMVDKFSRKIKIIVLNYNNINKLDYYKISNGVLYISGYIKDNNTEFYEINFYKAVTEVIFDANDNNIGISNAICNMVAEKVYNMDVNGSRIIMPKTEQEQIGDKIIKIRAGYSNYNLIISLLKQLFIAKKLNENLIIRQMYFDGYDKVIKDNFNNNNDLLLLQVLDKITLMYINRKITNKSDVNEKLLEDKYQTMINNMFSEIDQSYLAFCALITTDELREELFKKHKGE